MKYAEAYSEQLMKAREQFQRKVEAIRRDYEVLNDCAAFVDGVHDILIERLIELGELSDEDWCRR